VGWEEMEGIMKDINEKIQQLIQNVLLETFKVAVDHNNDCTMIICHITTDNWVADNWLYNHTEEMTDIIQKATNMIWDAPTIPGRNRWTLKKGAVHYSEYTGHPNDDGSTGKQLDEFHVFENGYFSEIVKYVDGKEDDRIDLYSHAEDFEFCEEPYS
jgi:hypothetical protein